MTDVETTPPARIQRRVVVQGRVQGVYLRGTTLEQARRLGLDGWVLNRRDGCVEARVEGAPEAVAALLRFLAQGPRHARVEHVDVQEALPEGLQGFEIRTEP